MGKIFILFFIIINCFVYGNETLKVKIPKNVSDMYLYRNMEEGKYKGLYTILVNGVAEKKGYNLKYTLQEENPDIVLRVTNKNEYKDYELIQVPTSYRVSVLVRNDGELKRITDLNGLKVGYVKYDRGIEELQKRFQNLNFEKVKIQNKSKALDILEAGEIDGLVLANWTVSNTLDKGVRVLDNFLYKEHIAVRKDLEDISSELKKEIREIDIDSLLENTRKSRIEFYKYILKDMPDYKYIKENFKKIKVGIPKDDYLLPLYYKNKGKLTGVLPNITKDLEEILEIPFIFTQGDDWNINGVVIRDRELDKKYIFSRPYYKSKMVIANRKEDSFEVNLQDLDNEKIILLKDEDLRTNISTIIENPEIVYVDTLQEGVEALKNHQGNFLIFFTSMIEGAVTNNFLEKEIKIAGTFNEEFGISLGFRKNDEALAQVLRRIMSSFTTDKTIIDQEANKNIIFERNYKLMAKIAVPTIIFIIILIVLIIKSEKNRKKAEKLGSVLVETLESVNQLDQEERGDHVKRLSLYSEFMAEKSKVDTEFIKGIKKFTSLHDIGKVIVPNEILNKAGKLTEEEFERVKQHTEVGYNLARVLGVGKLAENIVRYHHEKWNGKGYPLGLSEENIPLEGRIVALADTYDNLRQDKAYRKGVTHEKAVQIISEESGKSFDPKLVNIFMENHKIFEKIYKENDKAIYLADEIYTAIRNK